MQCIQEIRQWCFLLFFCKMKRRNANKRGNERKQENHGNDIKMVWFKI